MICAMVKSRVLLGMGDLPPLIGILIMGPYKPLRDWVDEFIPYYMEIMGVDRPLAHMECQNQNKNAESHGPYTNTHLICDTDEENPVDQVIQPSRQNLEV